MDGSAAAPAATSNVLEHHGNQQTMNLENTLYVNILSSPYFKDLYTVKTYHEVLEEIKTKVTYLGPWVPGAAKTPSTAYVLLFKLFTLKLTVKQVSGMLNSPLWQLRGMAFIYLRYICPPKKMWEWFEPYLEDEDEMVIYTKIPTVQTKALLRRFIKDHHYEETLFPRIPVPVQKDMLKKLEEHDRMFKQETGGGGGDFGGDYNNNNNNAYTGDDGPAEYEPLERGRDDYRGGGRGYRGGGGRRSRSPPRNRRRSRSRSRERRRSRSPRRNSRSPRRGNRSRSRSPARRRSRSPRRRDSRSPRRRSRSRSRSPARFNRSRSRSPRRTTPPTTSPTHTQNRLTAQESAAFQKIKALYGATTSTKFDDTKAKKDSSSTDTILLGSFARR